MASIIAADPLEEDTHVRGLIFCLAILADLEESLVQMLKASVNVNALKSYIDALRPLALVIVDLTLYAGGPRGSPSLVPILYSFSCRNDDCCLIFRFSCASRISMISSPRP